MLSVNDVVNMISGVKTEIQIPKNITFIVDESGSTGTNFTTGMSVLEKECSVVYEYILKNIHNNYNMYAFDSNCTEYPIRILKDENLVDLPTLSPKGSTCTHLPLVEINKKTIKPDLVILITDGQTNSAETILKAEINKFTESKIKFEIIAVSATNINLKTISQAEERGIPGMDLINYLANSVDKLTIYNQYHKDTPYEGATSSKINKSYLTFMGSKVEGRVHDYINVLLEKLNENKDNIDWGTSHLQFKKLVSEIGKLLSVYFITFPISHYFVETIVEKLKNICNAEDMTLERIMNIIKYGFECAKNEKPIMFTNFEQHIKEAVVKKAEFKTAIDTLKVQGTTLNIKKTICMPTNGACIINNKVIPMTNSLNAYPKSADQFGNVYFPCEENITDQSNHQAIRIALRELCSRLGFRDSRGPEPMFYVLNTMSLLFIKGFDLTIEHMQELQKLAIIQTSAEVMIAKEKYDGVGLYRQWKSGKVLPMHFSTPTVFHSSLYRDVKINPLKLEEPLWWALMMSMLGLFEEQRNIFNTALIAKGIEDEKTFLTFIRENYKDKVNGDIILDKIDGQPTSVFTLDYYNVDDEVYMLKRHGFCDTKTYYSKEEIDAYVKISGCVWCRHKPTMDEFELSNINKTNCLESLSKNMASCSPLTVSVEGEITNALFNKKFLINMIGITGAGKSTFAKKMHDYVISKGASCLIVSADKWSKRGHKGKQLQNSILKEITQFDKSSSEYKVIIVDICNENGPSSNCFGFNISDYNVTNFYPNLDKTNFDNYLCWCLRNVLTRPMHSEHTLYWLNPESAGVSTCIKVHNLKTNGLRKLLNLKTYLSFNEHSTLDEIMTQINSKASLYENYLTTKNMDTIIDEFIKSTGFNL